MSQKTAIVTGGVRGVGLAITQQLIKLDYKVVICSRNNPEIRSALKQLNKKKRVAYGIKTDISKFSHCKKLLEFANRKLGPIQVLVNNAGIYGPIGLLENSIPGDWLETIKVNLLGSVYCSQLVLPQMKKRSYGKIINLCGGGVGGKNSLPRFSAYYTSKIAVAGFTEVLAEETKNDNIRVNCIAPGAINSFFTDYLIAQGLEKAGEMMYQKAKDQVKNGGDSLELVKELVTFLVSDKSLHLSGCLLSAKWDTRWSLENKSISFSHFKLRRIDQNSFIEKL